MRHKNNKYGRSIMIPLRSITKNGFFSDIFKGNKKNNKVYIKGFESVKVDEITGDARLCYDKLTNRFSLHVPVNREKKDEYYLDDVCAIDPGINHFASIYGLESFGQLGSGTKDKILRIQQTIKKWQRVLAKNKNKDGEKLRNRYGIKKKIRKLYRKIQNIVREIHNQIALFLCKNYKRILIPKFGTKGMVSTGKRKIAKDKRDTEKKEEIEKIYNNPNLTEEKKEKS